MTPAATQSIPTNFAARFAPVASGCVCLQG